MTKVIAERGCGVRVPGAVYITAGLSPFGQPIEHFLFDPPQPIDPEALGLSPRGVTPIEIDGVTHVFDWVGSEHYPLVTDFVEELRRLGLSRRIPRSFPFERLTEQSRIVLLHRRGIVTNYEELYRALGRDRRPCPKGIPAHDEPPVPETMCCGLWWHDLRRGDGESARDEWVLRMVPSGPYLAREVPQGIETTHELALIASFSAAHLVVVRDPEGGAHEAALAAASRASVRVTLEDM